MDKQSQYLRPKNAAEFLGISRSKLYEFAEQDPAFPEPLKVSSRIVLYRSGDLRRWVEERGVGQDGHNGKD